MQHACLQVAEDASTAEALAGLRAEVRCIKHTRALQQGRLGPQGRAAAQHGGAWGFADDRAEARIAQLEQQLTQMEV